MQQTVNWHDPVSDVERALRNSKESFDQVRYLTPERFRFRVVDRDGHVVAGSEYRQNQSTRGDYPPIQKLIYNDERVDEYSVEEPAVPYHVLVAVA